MENKNGHAHYYILPYILNTNIELLKNPYFIYNSKKQPPRIYCIFHAQIRFSIIPLFVFLYSLPTLKRFAFGQPLPTSLNLSRICEGLWHFYEIKANASLTAEILPQKFLQSDISKALPSILPVFPPGPTSIFCVYRTGRSINRICRHAGIAETLLPWALKFQFLIVIYYIIIPLIYWSWFWKETKLQFK